MLTLGRRGCTETLGRGMTLLACVPKRESGSEKQPECLEAQAEITAVCIVKSHMIQLLPWFCWHAFSYFPEER